MRVDRLLFSPLLLLAMLGCSREMAAEGPPAPPAAETRLQPTDLAANPLVTAEPAPPVSAVPPGAAPAANVTRLTTFLYSEHDAEIGARIDGVVTSYRSELGDRVSAGQLLATLDDRAAAAEVESAQAALDMARAEHERATGLRAQQAISQAELDQTAYRVRAAQAALHEANVRLEYTRIRAPFAGTVSRRFVRRGQSVELGEPLFRITALQPLRAVVRVPELQSYGFEVGQTLLLRGLRGEEVTGRVSRIAPAVDPVSGTVEVLIDVANPAGLRPGAAVVAELASAAP